MLRDFEQEITTLERHHLRRQLCPVESPAGPTVMIQGRRLISMASNDYLGLANDPAVKQAAIAAIERWGVGSGAARLISGSMASLHQLEEDLARFKQVEATLTFGSGYTTNLGLIPSLIDRTGLILADRFCHASLIEGCRLARAKLRVFQHNNPEHLESLLQKRNASCSTLVVTEGVFSMDGDLSPIPDFVSLCNRYDATLLLDDAHGTGVMGKNGRGTVDHFGIDPATVIQMGTLSKALGVSGGFVAGPATLRDYLINTSKPFIFTTASPPALSAAASMSLTIIQRDPARRERLWRNREILYSELTALGFHLTNTHSPILPIIVKTPEAAMRMSEHLYEAGVFVPAIRPPTVPRGSSRLRLTVSSEHTPEQLHRVIEAIRQSRDKCL